ncbi:MAG: binding-protein-dependent transport system inner rane component [Thermomicrobiales bacterium]|nr:binding-protein-dependent transport system inner rane component [Thermomicrobiales bacterium]
MSFASPAVSAPSGTQTSEPRRARRSPGDRVLAAISSLVVLFLYLPLAVVVLYSFSAADVAMWPIEGYTFGWYGELAQDKEIQQALRLSIVIGVASATVAVVLGTLAALAIDRFEFPGKAALRYAAVLPITLPGIVTGVAMLSFFSFLSWPMSRWTLIIGHATFCIALVLNTVVARLAQLPRNIAEASADLGAPPARTFLRITLPLIRPAILAGAVLAFTLSFDEVIVSFFLQGREPTLPLLIWGRLRVGLSPEINAVATVIILVSLAGVLLSNRLSKQAALGG